MILGTNPLKRVNFILIVCLSVTFLSFVCPKGENNLKKEHVQWLNWDQAIKKSHTQPKKFFVILYTDWCLPCKQLEQTSLNDENLVHYINSNFYPIKLNAEDQKNLALNGKNYSFNAQVSKRGVNELALYLTDGNLVFPSTIIIDEFQEGKYTASGLLPVQEMSLFVSYLGSNLYKQTDWDMFKNRFLGKPIPEILNACG
ncbi:MAG: DUF255 domain-containing protein [Chitinophagales bacterium]|nr:DUF255 domain-containing protein [Bacteroidota bacterium]